MIKDKISREFKTLREHVNKSGQKTKFTQTYPFTTWSYIFDIKVEIPGDLAKLFLYLQDLILEGRPDIGGRKSVSQGGVIPSLKTQKKIDYITVLADQSLYSGFEHRQHIVLEEFVMTHDPQIIAMEVPVWSDDWMGHIDLIRWNRVTQRLEVLDFKPAAKKETKAASQLWRYRELLCSRLGIPQERVDISYFDKDNYYQVLT